MELPTYVVLSLVAGLLLRSTTGSVGKLIEMDDLNLAYVVVDEVPSSSPLFSLSLPVSLNHHHYEEVSD